MRDYIIRRVLLLIPNLFILATLTFFLARVLPGDVALGLVSDQGNVIDYEAVQQIRERLGLNESLPVQYARFMMQLLRGDLGHSDVSDQSVATVVAETAEVTFLLAILSVFIGAVMALPFGILSAMMRGRWPDQVVRTVSAVFLALPNFWVGILLLLALVTWFSWSPPIFQETFLDAPFAQFQRLILPSIAIGTSFAAVATRLTRSTMLEVLNQDYIRTARAKGLFPNRVIIRHALPNAVLPVITLSALLFAGLLNGAVVLERIFALPGMGVEIVAATSERDFQLLQGLVLVLGAFVMVWMLLIDLLYVVLDKRIQLD
jgi:peptide/nickel transport system permease protein